MISMTFRSFTRHQCGIVVLLGILQDRSGLEPSWSCGKPMWQTHVAQEWPAPPMNSIWMHLGDLHSIPRRWLKHIKALVYDWLHNWLYSSRRSFRRFPMKPNRFPSAPKSRSPPCTFYVSPLCRKTSIFSRTAGCNGGCFHCRRCSFALVVSCPIVDRNFD